MSPVSVYGSVEQILEKAQMGDLIEIGQKKIFSYQHWAVYVGDGFAVHVANINKNEHNDTAVIEMSKLSEIVGKSQCRINNLKDLAKKKKKIARNVTEIVNTARKAVGTTFKYRALSRNCEYFSTYCRFGEEFSGQVENATNKVGAAGLAFTILGGLLFVVAIIMGNSGGSSMASMLNN